MYSLVGTVWICTDFCCSGPGQVIDVML